MTSTQNHTMKWAIIIVWAVLALIIACCFCSCSALRSLRATGSTNSGEWGVTIAPGEPTSILLPPLGSVETEGATK